ncbi:MAG: D-2-hydroxyacid dehydrogenase [Ktedonobacteraceae bacterium]|jgi:phosphoglycerate dehydrogenase-like enzyme
MTNSARLVLIRAYLDQGWLERLQRLSPDLKIEHFPPQKNEVVPENMWHEAEIIYTFPWGLPTPQQVPNVRWVHLYSAGADRILTQPLYTDTSITFTTSSGVHAINIAEYVLTMVQFWYHRIPQLLELQHEKKWLPQNTLVPEELDGKTIGIVGYGSIGRQVGRLARAFGMRVLAMQNSSDHRDTGFQFPNVGDPDGTIPEHYYTTDQLHDLLRESDVVLIAVPLTPKTHHLFDASAFQAMKASAFLVNIARGEICDEQALIQAIEQKEIAGAALDVFEHEPLPSESPLWNMPNVFVTPHISGLTSHYNARAATIFEANLRQYLAGKQLYNVVDRSRGY